jgi:hypothetical protein
MSCRSFIFGETSTFNTASVAFDRTARSLLIRVLVALLIGIGLTSCAKTPKTAATSDAQPAQLHLASAKVGAPAATDRAAHIVLPNESLIGCKVPSCYQVLPDASSDASAVYPWQVRLDFNQPAIVGLIALYDQPTTIDDVQAAIDERYGKWAMADFRTGPVRLWRVDPSKGFAIQLSVNGDGMVQLIYLSYDPRHPTSDQGAARVLRDCKENDNSNGFACAMMKKALASR